MCVTQTGTFVTIDNTDLWLMAAFFPIHVVFLEGTASADGGMPSWPTQNYVRQRI